MNICQEDNCNSNGTVACWLPDDKDCQEITNYYCEKHAAENGYCYLCGEFWAGIESFDIVHPGLCDTCYDDLNQTFNNDDIEDNFDSLIEHDELDDLFENN
jgi:hypothetical protein